jgi:hypothetical protein
MFSNEFDVEIVRVFQVGIIITNFQFLYIKSNNFFFQIFYPNVLTHFMLFTFFLEFALFFSFFSQQELPG